MGVHLGSGSLNGTFTFQKCLQRVVWLGFSLSHLLLPQPDHRRMAGTDLVLHIRRLDDEPAGIASEPEDVPEKLILLHQSAVPSSCLQRVHGLPVQTRNVLYAAHLQTEAAVHGILLGKRHEKSLEDTIPIEIPVCQNYHIRRFLHHKTS